jgi:hypothetical protein
MTKFIRVLTFALLAPVVSASILVAQTAPENPKFTLLISTDKPEVTLGSDTEIVIKITNTSEDPITITCGKHGRMPDGYQFDMREEQGTAVARFGPRYRQLPDGFMFRLPDRPAGSVILGGVSIKPGKSMEEHAAISDDYNFDHPGKYTIRVWKPATMGTPEKPELNRIYSNSITVTVLPADSSTPADEPPPAQQ